MSRAELSRKLILSRGVGVLATLSKRMPGHPFASLMPYAVDPAGHPIFLMSGLAIHTKNILEDRRASLLVCESESEKDPLSSARMNLMGEVVAVPETEQQEATALYLHRHPASAQWVGLGDFALYRLEVQDVYYIGGFGEMGWVSSRDYYEAR